MDIDPSCVQRLFQAVVTKALIDAVSRPTFSKAVKRKNGESDIEFAARHKAVLASRQRNAARHRDEARAWLLGNGQAFQQICSLAGYNPDDIRERSERLADRRWPTAKVSLAEAA